jgi:hypothetical protein
MYTIVNYCHAFAPVTSVKYLTNRKMESVFLLKSTYRAISKWGKKEILRKREK